VSRKKTPTQSGTADNRGKAWRNYEEVAAYVLQEVSQTFGISTVEGKQKIKGLRSGTEWEIDAKAIRESDGALLIVECRRKIDRLTQEALGAVAYRIADTGAGGAITVSPHPLQRGAAKVAAAEGIRHVQLDPDSTRDQWRAQIEDLLMLGFTAMVRVHASVNIKVMNADSTVVEERDIEG
jgi:hypothetical protein